MGPCFGHLVYRGIIYCKDSRLGAHGWDCRRVVMGLSFRILVPYFGGLRDQINRKILQMMFMESLSNWALEPE